MRSHRGDVRLLPLPGVPVVVMEGDSLPGRMAYSFYKTMGLEQGPMEKGCCVARSRERLEVVTTRTTRSRDATGTPAR